MRSLLNIKIILIALFSIFIINTEAQTVRVLFIGNSLTFTNNLPLMFSNLAQANGKQIFTDNATGGGATLQDHFNSPSTIAKIQQGNWDYVVLQEQSQIPSIDTIRDSLFYPYAKSLDSIIHLYNTCGQTVFFMTYAHRNGDLGIIQNGGTDTYMAMQQRTRYGYMKIADSLNAVVCPVGWAFRESRIQYPNLELYQPDCNHPTDTGTYLAACTFYSTIFQDSSIGIPYSASIGTNTATMLQNIASDLVLDSLNLWNIGQYTYSPIADFSYNDAFLTINFHDSSSNSTSYYWTFGDGGSSILKNPVYTYQFTGTYNVQLIATNACASDTIVKQIAVVSPYVLPTAGFTYLVSNINVNFVDSSQNATSYYWDFGDGQSSTLENPIHNYSSFGYYNVTHIAINIHGSDTIVKQIYVDSAYVLPTSGFTYSSNNYIVNFVDSSQNATSYYWGFGDGHSSTLQNPIHNYSSFGYYNVIHIATNIHGSDTIIKQIIVGIIVQLPIANFNYSYLSTAFSIDFSDSSQFSTSYLWNFGDGNTSTQTNPNHTYLTQNNYTVKLVVSNIWGSDSISKQIQVNNTNINSIKNEKDFYVFQNPTTNIVCIKTSLSINSVEIRGVDYRLINMISNLKNNQVNISSLPKGIYFLVVNTKNKKIIRRIVKTL